MLMQGCWVGLGLVAAVACAAMAAGEGAAASAGTVESKAPEFARLVGPQPRIEKLAGGFAFTEGPVWLRRGVLLFSDIPNNVIRQWDPATRQVADFRKPSAHTNGTTLDRDGRLLCCEHSGRRVSRRNDDGTYETLVDRYQGKRLNSPNDIVQHSSGALYFTDPPYGLPRQDEDPARELQHNGVYRLHAGTLTLLTAELTRPNGLAFSPDERTLYVANSDPRRKIWMAYPVRPDGTLGGGKVFFDATASPDPGLPDGMKVDREGNLYCTGPGGVWVFDAAGKHLGTIRPAEVPANCAWGDDGRTLYLTAQTGLYRVRLAVGGRLP
jgi:gluconolactonase